MRDSFESLATTLLFVAGAVMVALAVVGEDRQSVAVALVGFGAALMSLAVLLPRLVGRVKVGVQGLEAELISAVQQQAEAQGLSPEETARAIEIAQTESEAWQGWLQDLVSTAALDRSGATDTGGPQEPIVRLAKRYVERERRSRAK